jgi:trwI-like protein
MADFVEHPIEFISESVLKLINEAPVDGLLMAIKPFVQQCFLFLLIYTGLRLILGYGEIKETLLTVLKIAFISTILYSAHLGFKEFVTPAIPGTRDFLIHAIDGKNSGNTVYQNLDLLIKTGMAIAQSAFNSSDLWSPTTYPYFFYAIAVIAATIFLAVIMTFVMLGSEIITRLLIAVGPFFIVSFLFHSTRSFFNIWIATVFSNIMLFVISAFFISLATSGMANIINKNDIVKKMQEAESIKDVSRKDYIAGQKEKVEITKEKKVLEERREREYAEHDCWSFAIKRTPVCKEIVDRYDAEEKVLKQRESEIDKKYKDKFDAIKQATEEPLNHMVYVGIILLLVIFSRTTSEIPSIAQSLSGGVGAAASAGSLAGELMKTAGRKAKALTLNPVGRGMKAGAGFIAAKTIGRFLPQSPTQKLIAALKENTAAHKQSSAVPSQYDNRGSSSGGRGSPNYENMSGHSAGNAHQSNNGGANQSNASAKHGSDTATSRQGSDAAGSGIAARQSSDSAKQDGDAAARSRDSGTTSSQQKSGDSANSGAKQGGATANARQGGGTTNNHNQINTSTHQGNSPSSAASSSAMNSSMNNNARNSDTSSPSGSQTASSSTPASTARSGTSERSQTPPPKSTTSKPESSSKPPEPPNKTSPKGNTNNEPSK